MCWENPRPNLRRQLSFSYEAPHLRLFAFYSLAINWSYALVTLLQSCKFITSHLVLFCSSVCVGKYHFDVIPQLVFQKRKTVASHEEKGVE